MKLSNRLTNLPPYLFAELDRQKALVRAEGRDLIDLSVGDPDLEPPRQLIEVLKKAFKERGVHRYPSYTGSGEFKKAVVKWLLKRHSVKVDPANEVLSLIGSKEGLSHLALALVDPGDVVLVPSPGYPLYSQAALLAGGVPYPLKMTRETNYLPVFEDVPRKILKSTKLLFLNYPNNPTSAVAPPSLFEKVVQLAHEYDFIVCHDAAYIEIHSMKRRPVSILSVPGAKEVAIEFHSFSKTFNITGWRVGFVVGNADVVSALAKTKQNIDSGVFTAIQNALVYAMGNLEDHVDGICSIYDSRRRSFSEGLERMGFHVWHSDASFYVWAAVPGIDSSVAFCSRLLEKTAIAAAPGIGFGPDGEGFIRFSLTVPTEQLEEAAARMAKM